MRKWFSSVTVLSLLTFSIVPSTHGYPDSARDKNKHSILGKWDSRLRPNGSGLTLEFLPDGTFREDANFEKQGRYSLKDNHLTTYTWDDEERRVKQRAFDLLLSGDEIRMTESNGKAEIQMERVCKRGSASGDIFGEWFSPNYPGAVPVFPAELPLRFQAFVEFTRDKRLFFRSTPLKTTQGQYDFSDGTLVLKLPSELPLRSQRHVSSDQTDIRVTSEGSEIPFRRVTGSECAARLDSSR